MGKIKIGISGAAGYTAGELIRILLNHPEVELCSLQSESFAGQPVQAAHPDLFFSSGLTFTSGIDPSIDVLFLCKGHGESVKILQSGEIDKNVRLIDLSQDFRLENAHPEIQARYGLFTYGLPELNRDRIQSAKNIANPGCFATCIQLGLLPLAQNHLLREAVHISAITGSTGAGQKLTTTSHFSWRNNNMSVYKPFRHQHLLEIRQSLTRLDPGSEPDLFFIPYRGNFTRGIIATMYIRTHIDEGEACRIFDDYYAGAPFVFRSRENIDLKQVVNTNYCHLYVQKIDGNLMVISTIDNLDKGASGQAVQNMNLMFQKEETSGLNLKATMF